MAHAPGHDSGHATGGLSWGDLLALLVAEHGTLAAVAWKLVEHAGTDEDVTSVERALRRLRTRGQRDGGRWGQRLLRVFGIPAPIEARVRWFGPYHSPFNDLPVPLCLDQLRLWDRPPLATSRARIWLHLGFASCCLRTRDLDAAATHAARARSALAALSADYDAARIEVTLVDAYIASRRAPETVPALLDRAGSLLLTSSSSLSTDDRACFDARLVDHRAYHLNKQARYADSLALYESLLPATHPFACYRRDAGRAYALHHLGRTADAIPLLHAAISHAGDGGYTRLRAMGLHQLARILDATDPGRAAEARTRALAIAHRLGDDELRGRFQLHQPTRSNDA
jgi:hypothetical protein